jgi:hypothetical protein
LSGSFSYLYHLLCGFTLQVINVIMQFVHFKQPADTPNHANFTPGVTTASSTTGPANAVWGGMFGSGGDMLDNFGPMQW